jgi:mono/diheme cytochrome c family protein
MRDTDSSPHPDATTSARGWPRWVPLLAIVVAGLLAPVAVDAATGVSDEVLAQGAEVYSSICSACHQPGGVGVPGSFPPLNGNPNVQDTAYVEGVIRNGRSGELTVDGTTYNGVMPAQSTLSADDVSAVIAYIQSGFRAPTVEVADVPTGPVAGTELPLLTDYMVWVAFLVALGAVGLVLGPKLVGVIDRETVPWPTAWLKTGAIVVGTVVATTILPAKVLASPTVEKLPREIQDLLAVGVWVFALGGSAWALWYAHRESRV